MTEGAGFRLECDYLHGTRGLAVAASSVNIGATSTTVTVSAATWATGIWASAQNAQVQFFKTTDGTLVSSGADSVFVVTSVNYTSYTMVITGTSTGIAALDTALGSVTCNIFFNGAASNGNTTFIEGVGLISIAANTGTLFSIDSTVFTLWQGNTYSASSAPLTFGKLQKAITLPGDKGLMGEDCTTLVPLTTFSDLLTEQAAARRYGDVKSKKMDNGADAIEFYSPSGTMDIVPHPLMKRGEAVIYPTSSVTRIGSSDLTFQLPGTSTDSYLQVPLGDNAGYQVRVWSDNTMFAETPSHMCLISGIVPRS